MPANVVMDVDNDFIRGRTNSPSKVNLKSVSVTSNAFSIPYYKRMETNNNLPNEEIRNPINSSQLLYKDKDKAGNSVRKATDKDPTRNQQCVQNKALILKNTPITQEKGTLPNNTNISQSEDVINIQIPYDSN